MTTEPPEDCPPSDYTDPTGEIISPHYPNDYPRSADCTYLIRVEEGMAVELTFDQFNTEAGWDFLRVYDGEDDSGTPITA